MRIIYRNVPGIEGKVFRFSAGLHWMHFDPSSGKELARGTASVCIPSETEAQEWQELANRLAAMWKDRLADLEKTLSIRYGKMPPNGLSYNYVTGRLEVGISVYPAMYDLVTGAIIFDDDYGVWQSGTLLGVMSRTPYLVEGDYVADGSDGEPLLRNVRKVAILSYDREKKGFFIKRRLTPRGAMSSSRISNKH
jgi:hypothetical protein